MTFPCSKDKKELIPIESHVIWRQAICKYLDAREGVGATQETLAATEERLRHLFDIKAGSDGSFFARGGEVHLEHKEFGTFTLRRDGRIFHRAPAAAAPHDDPLPDVQAVLDAEEKNREESAMRAPRAIARIARRIRKALSGLSALI